ncbi:MAG: alpha/beta fold hydrolase [Chloroflexi bacterium]|nr:alpha/beta fold hydrolase [Chloroflexota bacterium]
MKKKLRGIKRKDIQYDFDLYRQQVPIRGVSNAYLSVLDLVPENAKGTILFLHGYAGALESWEFQINHFARTYRVVAPDLRGHGQSDAPFTRYTMPELVGDMESVVEHLELPEKFVLVAHSFGGAIAIEYANVHPERLSHLVLIATAGEYPLPKIANLAFRIPLHILRPFWRFRPRWDAELHVLKRMMANNMRHWKGWELLRHISTPTLLITGERDTYFPRYVYKNVADTIPNVEVYDVGSAKHKVQLERHQAVNRAIARFIEGENHGSWRQAAAESNKNRIWIKHYDKDVPPTVPIPKRPLTSFLDSAANWFPKRTATIFYGAKLNYQQLWQRTNQFANVLHGMGVRPGDRVIIALPNMPQLVIAYYATLKIGGVVVMPNPDADAEQILHQIRQSKPKILITLQSFAKLAQRILAETSVDYVIFADIKETVSPLVYHRLMMRWNSGGSDDEQTALAHSLGLPMLELIHDAPFTSPDVKVTSDDLAVILFTSGATDIPKGVCLSHGNLVANTLQTRHWLGSVGFGKQVCLSAIPLMHSYGMTSAMNVPIAMGGTIVLLPVFEVPDVLKHIKKYKPTLFPGVPSMYMAINQAPKVRSYRLASIKACLSGAAPLPIEVQEAFEKLTRGNLVEGYGLTEASPVTHANPLKEDRKPGTIGIPLPNTEAKIIDLFTGEDMLPGQIGEMLVRGPQVMQGYLPDDARSEDATSRALRDGWLVTGDVAVMDEDGYFQIISRKRDTIMTGRYSVYPRDVEEVIYENNKVLEVAVVGIGTTDGTQKVKAFVVPRPGVQLSSEELLRLCRKRLEPYAVPWEIEFRQELPKSFVGKILRRMLVQSNQAGGVATSSDNDSTS